MFKKLVQSMFKFPVSQKRTLTQKFPTDFKLVVTKNDVDATVDFISATFIKDEPVVRAMAIQDTCDLQRYIKRQVIDSTTVKIVNKSCETVALAVCAVSTRNSSQETRLFAECSVCELNTKRLLNLWADIAESNNLYDCFNVKEIWEISMLAIAEDFRKQGLSKLVTQEARQVGKQEGLPIARMDCTSYYSASLASSMRFTTLPPRHISTFRDKNGKPWLENELPHPHGHVVVAYDLIS